MPCFGLVSISIFGFSSFGKFSRPDSRFFFFLFFFVFRSHFLRSFTSFFFQFLVKFRW